MPKQKSTKKQSIHDNSQSTANSAQLATLKKHFPNCFDKEGNFMSHKMEELVGDAGLELSRESYGLNWLGKSYARLLANEVPRTLLKEDKEHNAKEAHAKSENLLIKGDNLEVLKHLSHAYSEQIKMIYIDPPYNTGGDGFVYEDDRKFTVEELEKLAGIDEDEAKRILEFTSSKSNSHSAWLTFMYPRLYVARELLREDGVIFISIDDNEVAQLKILCDEVFGEENFVAKIMPIPNPGGRDYTEVAVTHEYLLVYGKQGNTQLNEIDKAIKFKFLDNIGGYEPRDLRNRNPKFHSGNRPNLFYSFYINPNLKDEYGYCAVSLDKNDEYHIEVKPYNSVGKESVWRWGKAKASENIIFNEPQLSQLIAKEKKDSNWNICEKSRKSTTKVKSIWDETDMRTENGTRVIRDLFGETLFSHPKSVGLIQKTLKIGLNSDDTILDFFAGSGTTAHAVMALNKEDGGKRKFITVQIPEKTDEKSEAHKAGYKTIFDITKARIEKASDKLGDKSGFKIFETMPLFEGYLDDIQELEDDTKLFNGSDLDDEDLAALLTTWKAYDGSLLTKPEEEVMLGDYGAKYVGNTLYFMYKGFSTEALKALMEKLDEDKTFEPSKLVLFGYNFESKYQRELKEALAVYTNKKEIDVEMVVRY